MKAIYAVVAESEGYARIAILGDFAYGPVYLEGRSVTDALGYRTTQYDELLPVDLATFRAENDRRVLLVKRLVWEG